MSHGRPPLSIEAANASVLARFESYTIPEPNSGCLLWMGPADKLGYAKLSIAGTRKFLRVSHLSLQYAGRPVPSGMVACHSCDNPYCVEPNHLFHGTMKDNTDDMVRKGRNDLPGFVAWRKSKEYPQWKKDKAAELFKGGMLAHIVADTLQVDRTTCREWLAPHGYVSVRERAKTHCGQGHLRTPENTIIVRRGERRCKICARLWRKKAAASR